MAVGPLRFQSFIWSGQTAEIYPFGLNQKNTAQRKGPQSNVPPVENPSEPAIAEGHYELAANDFWKLIQGDNS